MSRAPKILISGGGTGGHVFPAIAIAQAFRGKYPNAQILFVGAKGKMEMEKVPAAGFKIIGLTIAGFQRKQLWKNWSFPFKLLFSLYRSFFLVLSFRPDALVGVGGYASGPLLKMGQLLGKRTFLQEQNAFPGATNRLLGKGAEAIFAGFPGLEKFFDAKKITHTGNPIREDLVEKKPREERFFNQFGLKSNNKTLLVIGGSLGAKTINEGIAQNLESILDLGYQVVWQCGKTGMSYADQFGRYDSVWVGAFINNMPAAYSIADVVISRAGALSIAEILAQEIPLVLVPSPNVTDDHQTKNALSVVDNRGGLLIRDQDFAQGIMEKLTELDSPTVCQEMKSKQRMLAKTKAAQEIVGIISQKIYG